VVGWSGQNIMKTTSTSTWVAGTPCSTAGGENNHMGANPPTIRPHNTKMVGKNILPLEKEEGGSLLISRSFSQFFLHWQHFCKMVCLPVIKYVYGRNSLLIIASSIITPLTVSSICFWGEKMFLLKSSLPVGSFFGVLSNRGLQYYTFFGISSETKWRMIDIAI